MSSAHVVVLDSSARRAVIKTNPGKHLSDVLQEACGKLGLDATRHGLKYCTYSACFNASRWSSDRLSFTGIIIIGILTFLNLLDFQVYLQAQSFSLRCFPSRRP